MRNNWSLKYKAKDLLAAAEAKFKFHEQRLEFWKKKHAETKDKIQSTGIIIDESVADLFGKSTYSNAGRQSSVMIDQELVRDFNECTQKVTEHTQNIKVFDGWVQFFSADVNAKFEVEQEDWLFFYGK